MSLVDMVRAERRKKPGRFLGAVQILGVERLVWHEGVSREIEGFYALEEAERNDSRKITPSVFYQWRKHWKVVAGPWQKGEVESSCDKGLETLLMCSVKGWHMLPGVWMSEA